MSISTEYFRSEGHFIQYGPPVESGVRTPVFRIECRRCGFEPEDSIIPPRVCPKCNASAWERSARRAAASKVMRP
jgi:rubrerythrin